MFFKNKETSTATGPSHEAMNDKSRIAKLGGTVLELCGLMRISAHKEIVSELHQEIERDQLTGLLNKKYFIKKSNEQLEAMSSTKEKAAIMLIDLDGFKAINDTHGHTAGDNCLRLVGDCLRESVRSGDESRHGDLVGRGDRQSQHVSRLGGDEFGLFLHLLDEDSNPVESPNEAAESIKQRLNTALLAATEDLDLLGTYHLNDIDLSELKMSIGYTLAGNGDNAEALLDDADKRMYAEKYSRKNAP